MYEGTESRPFRLALAARVENRWIVLYVMLRAMRDGRVCRFMLTKQSHNFVRLEGQYIELDISSRYLLWGSIHVYSEFFF